MSSPFSNYDAGHSNAITAGHQQGDGDDDVSNPDIPKRIMRVKVLYTFDNENKTHCLARLVRPIPIQVVALDETTEIGVVKLRTCIQAIVAASPEMIAKLENDYTVYAYDYSEYETPLVGQGMLSWVLATASQTPDAPASESVTMVTGRVCRNIMGLFASGGVKETLEVKLKLVPVSSRSKREYLQSMAIYRDPSVVMPEGFDGNAWNSFLQAIPDAGSLADAPPMQQGNRANVGGVEQLHDMLTPRFGGADEDYFSNGPSSSRAGSPTPSQRSVSHAAAGLNQSRPASRAAYHGPQQSEPVIDDQDAFEDGSSRKRARLTQASWRGRGSFGASADSLRVAVSTSASLREFRPSSMGSSALRSELIQRPPTPRANEKRMGRPGIPRATSSLCNEAMGQQAPQRLSDAGLRRLDSGIYSMDYDGGSSHQGSPSPDLPSSPPEYTPIEPPSSPLPELPQLADSGFQSDLPSVQEPCSMAPPLLNKNLQRKARGEIEWSYVDVGPKDLLPTSSFPQFDPLSQKSALAAANYRSGTRAKSPGPGKPTYRNGGRARSKLTENLPPRQTSSTPLPVDQPSPSMLNAVQSIETSIPSTPVDGPPPDYSNFQAWGLAATTNPPQLHAMPATHAVPYFPATSPAGLVAANGHPQLQPASRGPTSADVILPKRNPDSRQGQKPRPKSRQKRPGFKTSSSWIEAASSDIDSDNGQLESASADLNNPGRPRIGSGLVRSQSIQYQLQEAIKTGKPVKFCNNCGEIQTPTWRPYWLRDIEGDGKDVNLGPGTGIHLIDVLEKNEAGETTKFRIYKQYAHISPDERKLYAQHLFCNPCGGYIQKWGRQRPRNLWDPTYVPDVPPPQPAKKKRGGARRARKQKEAGVDALTSDFPMPSSEWDMTTPFTDMHMFTDPFVPSEGLPQSDVDQTFEAPPPNAVPISRLNPGRNQTMPTSGPAQSTSSLSSAMERAQSNVAALQRAIQSSPARESQAQEADAVDSRKSLTPKPTRRLLFPSPRGKGQFKSLGGTTSKNCDTNERSAAKASPASKEKVEPSQAQSSTLTQCPKTWNSITATESEVDKENLPPPINEDDEFAHLFEEGIFQSPESSRTSGTPSKAIPRTPNSRSKFRDYFSTGLTPTATGFTPNTGSKRRAECMGPPETTTPTKRRSPRLAERQSKDSVVEKHMTPFTRSLNQMLSDGLVSSPSRAFGWTLTSSPAKNLNSTFGEMAATSSRLLADALGTGGVTAVATSNAEDEANMWSDFPMPSSPPLFSRHNGDHDAYDEYDWSALDMTLAGSDVHVFEDGTATDAARRLSNDLEQSDAHGGPQGNIHHCESATPEGLGQSPVGAAADDMDIARYGVESPALAGATVAA